jgi:uncharacterized protein
MNRNCRRAFVAASLMAVLLFSSANAQENRKSKTEPLMIEDQAVDFPNLPIIMAHPSFPWQDEAISICLHKPNVYIDLSGWSPKYFSPTLIQYANSRLRTKVLFGSDYPFITPDRWLADFAQTSIRDDVRPLIVKENAVKLLQLNENRA